MRQNNEHPKRVTTCCKHDAVICRHLKNERDTTGVDNNKHMWTSCAQLCNRTRATTCLLYMKNSASSIRTYNRGSF